MIEKLVLPNRPGSSTKFIDTAGRRSLNGSQDFRKCEGPAIDIPHGREQQVCVIGHDYDGMNLDCLAIVMEAVLKGWCSCLTVFVPHGRVRMQCVRGTLQKEVGRRVGSEVGGVGIRIGGILL
jgi:hypothetical protein